jgi:4-alpha-glucanotransferase
MNRVNLIFGTVNSQPIGADHDDIEDTYQRCYKPFIRALYNAPRVRATLYYSGALLQWLEQHHSEFIDVLSELLGRRQVEVLGSGFYDPILAIIPRADRLGQIERMTTYLRKLFGRRPRGLWVTEQVWEPSFPSLLRTSGIDYTFLDADLFSSVGLNGSSLCTPCITEDEGKTVVAFPFFREIELGDGTLTDGAELPRRLEECSSENDEAVVSIFLEGEKMALDGVTDDEMGNWFRRFFDALDANRDWITTRLPTRYLRQATPRQRCYFPTTSFRRKYLESVEGKGSGSGLSGVFRHVLVRYPESNLMYAKMQYTHVLVNQIRGDKYRKQLAREELWKGQCHNAYWNAGIYRSSLRGTVYAALIDAERVTREQGIFSPSIVHVDFDMDGLTEYLYQGQEINAYVHLRGGMLFELDYLRSPWNYADTFARYPEFYTPNGDGRPGFFDRYLRRCFVDHAFSPIGDFGDFQNARKANCDGFPETVYRIERFDRDKHELALTAHRRSPVYVVEAAPDQSATPEAATAGADARGAELSLVKIYRFTKNAVTVTYHLEAGDQGFAGTFATELNLALPAPDSNQARATIFRDGKRSETLRDEKTTSSSVTFVEIQDFARSVLLQLRSSQNSELWSMSLESLVQGEEGPEPVYEGRCFVPQWPLELGPKEQWTVQVSLTLNPLQ